MHQLLCSARLFKPIPLPIPANEEKRAKKENKKGDNCNNCSADAYSCQCHLLLVQILVLAIGDLLLGFSPLLHYLFEFPPLLNLLHLLFGFSSLLHFLLGFSILHLSCQCHSLLFHHNASMSPGCKRVYHGKAQSYTLVKVILYCISMYEINCNIHA